MRFDEIDLLIKIEDFVTANFVRNHVDAFAKEDEEALGTMSPHGIFEFRNVKNEFSISVSNFEGNFYVLSQLLNYDVIIKLDSCLLETQVNQKTFENVLFLKISNLTNLEKSEVLEINKRIENYVSSSRGQTT